MTPWAPPLGMFGLPRPRIKPAGRPAALAHPAPGPACAPSVQPHPCRHGGPARPGRSYESVADRRGSVAGQYTTAAQPGKAHRTHPGQAADDRGGRPQKALRTRAAPPGSRYGDARGPRRLKREASRRGSTHGAAFALRGPPLRPRRDASPGSCPGPPGAASVASAGLPQLEARLRVRMAHQGRTLEHPDGVLAGEDPRALEDVPAPRPPLAVAQRQVQVDEG